MPKDVASNPSRGNFFHFHLDKIEKFLRAARCQYVLSEPHMVKINPRPFILASLMPMCSFAISNPLYNPTQGSSPELCSEIIYLPGLSGHLILNFSITVPKLKTARMTKTLRNYHHADFNQINSELDLFLTKLLEGFELRPVETNRTLFKNKVTKLTNHFIPIQNISYNPKAPWYNTFIRRLSNRKKHLYWLDKTSCSQFRWSSYRSTNDAYFSAVK